MIEKNASAILLLEDGTHFVGKAAGTIGTTSGEIAFNTGMTGYQEIFTDPSYYSQIVVMATSHIGNYGVAEDEVESEGLKIAGLVTKKFSDVHSRIGAMGGLDDYMKDQNVAGISDIDTRALIRHIRTHGAMNAIISSEVSDLEELKNRLAKVPSMQGLELSSHVTCTESYVSGSGEHRIALLDLGVKKNIVRCLVDRGSEVKVFPLGSSVEEMLAYQPNGIMLSNGPGDPEVMKETIEKTKKLIGTGIPVFGICLGHQIIALSQGLATEKMFNGHRGINHPIKNLITGKSEITSQNHGFVVSKDSVTSNDDVELTHIHLNDDSVAGIRLLSKPVFSVQYHPEASAGPHDSRYLFDQFIENIATHKQYVSA